MICNALFLMTGKKWQFETIRGCSQSDWQQCYVSEEITSDMLKYLEICYFNTGCEYRVYENKEDFDNEENSFSVYVDSYDSEQNLIDNLGCDKEEIEIYKITGYTRNACYERYSF